MYKAPLKHFLSQNPFPAPYTLGFFYRQKMWAIHQISPNSPFTDILEVGGGQSGLTALLYPEANIANLDLDPQYAAAPCNQDERVRFLCGDGTHLPFEDCSFDMVTMFDLLEHVPDDKKAISEALRVLRPYGFLLVSSPNENWQYPYYNFMKYICPHEDELFTEWGHVRRGYSMSELNNLIRLPCKKYASFNTPVTVICHDVSFSRLSHVLRRGICAILSPLTWIGYFLHKPESKGTETVSAWQKGLC
jgi:SAM-dependent methyltransferase